VPQRLLLIGVRGPAVRTLERQISSFFGVGLAAAAVHYGLLAALVEIAGLDPVAATLAGYVGGGIVSYALNRRLTYASTRPHAEATWRFAVVALVGFLLTFGLMSLFGRIAGARFEHPSVYLPCQLVTTGIVLFWSFVAHKLWTFAHPSGQG
jgi:putative flippase GtrA